MPKTKKKFIDRKKAVTFNLVHRSQRDPLTADESAPQRVLVPVNAVVPPRKDKDPDLSPDQRIEQQRKYGIYFDDDYNYLQHLKDTREVTMVVQPKITHKRKEKAPTENPDLSDDEVIQSPVKQTLNLPSSVFASEVEEEVGLMNKAATQGLCLDLDPEVVAALDEDFNFEDPDNVLEDNFIELAMAEGGDDYGENDEDDDDMSDADDSDRAFASDLDSDDDGESQRGPRRLAEWDGRDQDDTKSRFSQYSMSSSVIRRNQGLSLLDNRFEKMFAEYDDTELGSLECEEIEGYLPESHERLLQAADEFALSQQRQHLDKEREMARFRRLQEIEEESESEELVPMRVPPQERWDCETILSTYSNLYNHPKIIDEPKKLNKIKIDPKTGIPKEVLGKDNKLTMKTLAKFNAMNDTQPSDSDSDADGVTRADTLLSTLSVLSIRPKDESPEEKKERKRILKEYRKERRIEKKANKEAFKEEKKRQEKIMLNNKNNVQGNKIL